MMLDSVSLSWRHSLLLNHSEHVLLLALTCDMRGRFKSGHPPPDQGPGDCHRLAIKSGDHRDPTCTNESGAENMIGGRDDPD